MAPGSEAARATGVGETYPVDEFAERLPGLLDGAAVAHVIVGEGTSHTLAGLAPIESPARQLPRGIARLLPDARLVDARPVVERMRLVKDEHEIAALRQAAEISAAGLIEAMGAIRPGMNDLELAELMEYAWKRDGSPRPAFGPIVSSGPASISLYTLKSEKYRSTDHLMKSGELVFIDYGAAEYRTYASDVCRTYPVDGRFTERQRYLYGVVLEAQDAALGVIAPGITILDVVRAVAAVFQRYGFAEFEDIDRMGVEHVWGVMPSPTHYLIQGKGLTDYSGARGTGVRELGHHIGIEATDGRDYSAPLEVGWVFTVEPKLYVPAENVAIMIEDMIVVTEDGYENLSAGAPKSIEDIERIMGRDRAP